MAVKKQKTENVNFRQLKKELSEENIGKGYIFYGEETYLREYYLNDLRKKLVPAGFEEFNYHRLEGKGLSVQSLTEAVEAMPMMAERTLTVVTDFDIFALNEEQRGQFMELLADLPDYGCVVFVYDLVEYKPNKTMKKLCAAVENAFLAVKFEAQDSGALHAWIARHFRALGKDIDQQACEHMIFTCGDLMTGLLPEIEKVAAYAKGQRITVKDIDAVAAPILEAAVFDMTKAVSSHNYDRAAEILANLFQQQEEPFMILAVLGKELRKIYTARIAIEGDKDRYWLMELWNMRSDYAAKLAMESARKVTKEWCSESMKACQVLDRRLKSEKGVDAENELKVFLMQLAQTRRQ